MSISRKNFSEISLGILQPEIEGKKEQPTRSVVFSKEGFSSTCFFKVKTDGVEEMKTEGRFSKGSLQARSSVTLTWWRFPWPHPCYGYEARSSKMLLEPLVGSHPAPSLVQSMATSTI